MNAIEQSIINFLKERHAAGELSVTAAEIYSAIIPADQPKLRYKPAYKYAIERLSVRHELNAVVGPDGTYHYFIGNFASKELRASLGLQS